MEKKKKKRSAGQYFTIVLYVIIGASWAFFDPFEFDKMSMSFGEYMVKVVLGELLVLFVAGYIHIIIHEVGHLLFGLLTGYRFSSFRIGSLMFVKENGKLRFKRMKVLGTGGQCLMLPPEREISEMPYALYNLGGSIMNVIASVIFAAAYIFTRDNPYLAILFMLMTLLGLASALMNGIPLRLGTVDNDGYNARSLGKSPEALLSLVNQLKVSDALIRGMRLKDMPDDWFFMPDDGGLKNSMTVVMAVFSENRLMDMHRFDEAVELMDKLKNSDNAMIGLHSSLIDCDRIFCELIGKGNADIIESLLSKDQLKFMKQMQNNTGVIRTEYALALLYQKDSEKAEKLRMRFEKIAKKSPYKGDTQGERELMEIALNMANNNV